MTDTIAQSSGASSETVSLTVTLPRELVERLAALGTRANGSIERLMADMLADRVPYLGWKFAQVEEALAELDAGGPTYSNEEVMAWIESRGTPNDLPLPDERQVVKAGSG